MVQPLWKTSSHFFNKVTHALNEYVYEDYTREIYTYKDLYMNVYSHLIYNSLKLEKAQMMVKTKVIIDNKKEQTNDKFNNTDESQHYEGRRKRLPNV